MHNFFPKILYPSLPSLAHHKLQLPPPSQTPEPFLSVACYHLKFLSFLFFLLFFTQFTIYKQWQDLTEITNYELKKQTSKSDMPKVHRNIRTKMINYIHFINQVHISKSSASARAKASLPGYLKRKPHKVPLVKNRGLFPQVQQRTCHRLNANRGTSHTDPPSRKCRARHVAIYLTVGWIWQGS